MTRLVRLLGAARVAALLVPACLVLGPSMWAQEGAPKGKEGAPKGKAGAGKTYQGRLLAVREDARRIVFQTRQGESWRIFNMMIADQARVQAGGQDAGLGSLRPNTNVTISTRAVDGLQKVVAINVGGQGAAGQGNTGTGGQGNAGRGQGSRALEGEATGGKVSLAYPTGDRSTSVLLIESQAPDQVRVGQSFDYRVKVTNISKNLMLEAVRVSQILGSPAEAQAGRTTAKGGKGPKGGAAKQPAAKGDEAAAKDGPARDPDPAADGADARMVRWTIPVLTPGESVTLRAQTVAHEEGVIGACFRVTYQPALCVRIQAVKPELELTKSAPDTARLCGELSFQYTVKNTGSAVAKGVTITETLPDGLTVDGKQGLAVVVGDLKPGQEVTHTAKIQADGRGSYTSRATAKTEGGLTTQSRRTTTRIQEADLSVNITGSQQAYAQQAATYTVTVRNEGDAPAPGTKLNVKLDPQARFVKASAIRTAQPAGKKDNPDAAGAGPKPGEDGNLTWNLGTLPPGASRKATITVTGRGKGTLKHVATATFECDRARDQEQIALARGTIQTEVIVVPALRLSLVDQSDLIPVGDTVTYTLRIVNQGTGPDQNLAVKLKMPEGLQFVEAVGPTNGQADGDTVTFGTIKELAAGQTLSWNIRAKAMQEGDVRTTAELNSEYLDTPVSTTEPTRLVK